MSNQISPAVQFTPNSPRSAGTTIARTPASRIRTPSSGIPLTPSSFIRSDLASGRRAPIAVPLQPQQQDGPNGANPGTPMSLSSSPNPSTDQTFWGTTVHLDTVQKQFTTFFREFKDETGEFLYPRLLQESVLSGITNLNLNCRNLLSYDKELYKNLCAYPQEMIPAFDMVLENEKKRSFPDENQTEIRIQIRPFNLEKSRNMRELNPEDIDTLISVRGMVIRLGGIIPEMKRAHFQCLHCDDTKEVNIDQGQIAEPTQCEHCRARYSMQLIHNRCLFTDKQLIKVQETPDSIPEGETPHTINIFAYDDLVDVCKPGDRVEITGVYRAQSVKTNTRKTQLKTIFRTMLDALHFKKTDERRLHLEDAKKAFNDTEFHTTFEESDVTSSVLAERENKLRALGADPTIYDRLTASLAPSVWELDDVKRGILCQLFGGSNHEQGAGHGRFRGELNVLMCGDPGTSKSQLLQYVHKIAPRGIYTSGKGSSAVGLTASIYKDPETREMILESGALVLSDRGICCIDEFDKMSDSTRSILHEVMEQQTVSIAKAGIVCTLNARTSILASANPKESRYNPKLSVVQNIQLMPTLLSRFDLIYLVLDQPNELKDRRLARHIVSLYFNDPPAKQAAQIDTETLSAYISYARKNITPKLSTEAEDQLIEAYVKMRKLGQNAQSKVVTATPRQLESLIRLSEALARMKLCEIVTRDDVIEAQRLMSVATQTAATDPTTGQIDMDMITTGTSSGARARLEKQIDGVREFITNRPGRNVRLNQLLKEFNEPLAEALRLNSNDMQQILESLVAEGVVAMGGQGRQQDVIRKL